MSQLNAGTVVCDKCGGDCGNGSPFQCMIVSRINEAGHVDTFHFCEGREEDGKKVKGCASSIMTKTHLKNFVVRQEVQEQEAEKARKIAEKEAKKQDKKNSLPTPDTEVENGKQDSR